MAPSSEYSAAQRRGEPPPTPQLSCELCRERKVKCDKLEPCTTCVSAGVECMSIYRQRLPRGRHSQRKGTNSDPSKAQTKSQRQPPPPCPSTTQPDSAVTSTGRTAVGDISDLKSSNKGHGDEVEHSRSSPVITAPYGRAPVVDMARTSDSMDCSQSFSPYLHGDPTVSSSIAGSNCDTSSMPFGDLFWANSFDPLEEFDKLPETTFSAPDDLDFTSMQVPELPPVDKEFGPFRMLCAGGSDNIPPAQPNNSAITFKKLCRVYLDQVDPVIKILHRPSLRNFMECGEPYLNYPTGHTAVAALSSAVCYSAACSLTERQCQSMFQMGRPTVIAITQQACESALEKAEVLITSDMTVVQAFVLYLVGRRSKEHGRVVWSLVSLAVRLAKGMALQSNPISLARGRGESFFDRQMRKRLWLTICVMDLQASFAYGSEPLIGVDEVSSALDGLRHLNDSDFVPGTSSEVLDKEELTDTTFPFVTYLAQISGRLLNHIPRQEDSESPSISSRSSFSSIGAWSEDVCQPNTAIDRNARRRVSSAFDQKAFTLLRFCDPEETHRSWFTWHSTQTLVAATRLASLRPLPQPRSVDQSGPTNAHRDQCSPAELQLGLRILEKVQLMHTDARSEGLRWYVMMPAHALAIAVAGCHACTDEGFLRRVWPTVEFVWQLGQSQSGARDQKPVTSSMEKQYQEIRERLNPMPQRIAAKPVIDIRPANAFSSLFPSTSLHTPRTSDLGGTGCFLLPMQTTTAEGFRVPSSTAAPNGVQLQNNARTSWDDSAQEAFAAHAGFDLGRPVPIQQNSADWPCDGSALLDLDGSFDVNMDDQFMAGYAMNM